VNAILPSDFPRLHDSEAEPLRPGRLWSLWDMLRVYAEEYIVLGELIEEISTIFIVAENLPDTGHLKDGEIERIGFVIKKMIHQCKKIKLTMSLKSLREMPERSTKN
jgi:hypothetical protein